MCDYDQLEAYKHILRRARKQHKCCECTGKIETGESYHYHSGCWDGTAKSWKICQQCNDLRCNHDLAFGYLFDAIFNGSEDLTEMQKFIANHDLRGGTLLRRWAREKAARAEFKDYLMHPTAKGAK